MPILNLLSIVVVATDLLWFSASSCCRSGVYTQSFSAGADFDPTLAVYFLLGSLS